MKIIILLISTAFLLSGCGFDRQKSAIADYDYSQMQIPLPQIAAISQEGGLLYEGQPIAVITTSAGVIRIALFPEFAPNTVASFIANIKEGFYDDSAVLAIMKDEDGNNVFFQAGLNSEFTPKTDDSGVLVKTDNEYSVNMWPFKGAIGAYSDVQGVSDSRFFIVNGQPKTPERLDSMREWKNADGEQLLPNELIDSFKDTGGAVTLSGFYTIFGQTIEGIDIVEAICAVPLKGRSPADEIKIISIEIEYYEENQDED
jgi:peptidyl-prolyl cis-trans isomerase B (cyclophilin B)